MRKKLPANTFKCCDCELKDWVTDKEWNYSIQDHLPLTLVCHLTGQHRVRSEKACNKIPQYVQILKDNGFDID